jgi:uncharacterized protein (TIGR02677 family)
MRAWFVGAPGRRAEADNVRRLATDAMRALLTNLHRISAGADRQQSRYGDLVRLAGWFDAADDDRAHELWANVFGLYPARHLGYAADPEGDPVPSTASWWKGPVAEVPLSLRETGVRQAGGASGARVDFGDAKRKRLAERGEQQRRRAAAFRELGQWSGRIGEAQLSDAARSAYLELHALALTGHGRPLTPHTHARAEVRIDGAVVTLRLAAAPGERFRLVSPSGTLALRDLAAEVGLLEATPPTLVGGDGGRADSGEGPAQAGPVAP